MKKNTIVFEIPAKEIIHVNMEVSNAVVKSMYSFHASANSYCDY